MIKFCYIIVSVLFSCCVSVAQNIIIKPYLQNITTNTSTIMWEVDAIGTGEVKFGLTPFSMNTVVNSDNIVGNGASRIHMAILPNLTENTKYYYKVKMEGGQESSLFNFKTISSSTKEQSVQLMAISDMQRDGSHPDKFQEIIEQGIIPIVQSEVGPDLNHLEGILIPGDLVPTGGSYNQWKDYFFNPSDSLSGYVPFYPVLGNHEYYGDGEANFLKYFELPNNAPPGLKDQVWYKDISNVRIIGLNSNSGTSDQNIQLDWLSEVLDSSCNAAHIDFVFAQLHHPYKSELWTPGENDFTGKVIDSLEIFTSNCNKPSIHFFGHTHAYSRGQSRDHKHLWVNVATAGGAIDNWGEFPNADYEEFVKSQDEYGFVFVEVEAGTEPQFTLTRYSRGDQDAIQNNVIRDEVTIFQNEWIPYKPENIYPEDGDTILSTCLNLKASAFAGVNDSLQASHWQIAKGGNFQDSIVSSSWAQSENYYNEQNLQANDDLSDAQFQSIPSNQVYHWRVRYRDQNLEWSPWSEPTTLYLESGGDTLSTNLVQNNGAENGITSWTGQIESLNNGECNSVNPYMGSYNFAVGGVCTGESTVGLAKQTIDLSNYSTVINAGDAIVNFGGYMRSFNGVDVPEIYLEFYNAGNLLLTTNSISSNTGSWQFAEDFVSVPSSSTDCSVYLKGTRNSGSDNDSYFDELQFYVMTLVDCLDCYGESNIDIDLDGFCSDIDCNDNDNTIYPGAKEICDGKDNNCDGISDNGDLVTWTGNGGSNLWSNPNNWDQLMVPLSCQNVLIDNSSNVLIDSAFACKSLDIAPANTLTISNAGFLFINSQFDNPSPSAVIRGSLLINGRCDVVSSSGIAFEVSGILINTNKMNVNEVQAESVLVNPGGRFESLGKTIIR